jgi:hypothetical protein
LVNWDQFAASGTVQFTNDMRVGFTGLASNSNAIFQDNPTKKTVAKVDKAVFGLI